MVLQNNGGNDLSVSSNGPFTFSTLLADGAAYSVTVKTNPSGQTCTASNASGTVASANVTNIAVACTANSATSGSDDFNRADGSLGANWTDITDGGLSISSQAVLGSSSGLAGDIRTGETYASDQYSQVEVTSTQLSGGQWIGPAVRTQNGGQNTYLGIYFWNSGSPELRLYKRSAGTWIQLGSSYSSGPLAAGTQLKLTAVGSTISFLQNGVARITVSDSSFTGGAPGIISYGAATADNWTGGTATAPATYSIGGTVSGLSGTVVLQNNGGNDLSVSSNGPFTFSTLLPDGAAYNVTVKTNPSGQTCTASNASGTVASANVTTIAVACTANSATSGSDDFNRADGSLGANWTDITDGGLSISSQAVLGSSSGLAGDIRTGETYSRDQYSQLEITSTQLSGGQWIGPAVRSQNGGQDTYLGIYFWNSGSPELRLYKRSAGTWTQLGNSYSSGPLAAGTQLKLTAVGSTISFLQNGVARITVTDSSFTGGAPAIISYGAATADNWTGGTATPPATYSIGGTVSGLSGTVVLQNNGGNDLSVSSNGPFTFSTLLANGAAYNVTVKTNPSGQTCTASNASGTVASANVTTIAVACTANSATSGSDDFNRTDGSLGANWTDITDGGLSISSQAVLGSSGGLAGDIRTGETYSSDQYSQLEVTSTQLSGGQWIGPAVRSQNGGQRHLPGHLLLEQRQPRTEAVQAKRRHLDPARQLLQQRAAGRRHPTETHRRRLHHLLPAKRRRAHNRHRQQLHRRRTRHHLLRRRNSRQLDRRNRHRPGHVFDRRHRFRALRDGGVAKQRRRTISASAATARSRSARSCPMARPTTSPSRPTPPARPVPPPTPPAPSPRPTSPTSPSPARLALARFQIHYRSTDANGVATYDVTSADNGYGTQELRVLAPTNPAPGVAHNFLYVLPVEAGLATTYGDGLETLRALDAQDQYNLTIIEPSFAIEPWYADNPTDPNLQYETFMTKDLLPWVTTKSGTNRSRAELADRVLEIWHRRRRSHSETS